MTVYTVAALMKMKRKHELKCFQIASGQNLISKHPSVLNMVIGSLGRTVFSGASGNEPLSAPDPEGKIQYNNIVRYREIIEEYKVYQGKINRIYEEIEMHGAINKEYVLLNIKTAYLNEKKKYRTIDEIRSNADRIIENVELKLWDIIERSSNTNSALPIEAI